MNKFVSALLGAMAIAVTASTGAVAAPALTDGAQVETVQYAPYGYGRPIYRPHRYYRRHFHRRPFYRHGFDHRFQGRGHFRR